MEPNDRAARVVLPCDDLDPTVGFFLDLGFRLDAVSPADAPVRAVISGKGLRIELERGSTGGPGVLRLPGSRPAVLAPNGTRIEWVDPDPAIVLPPLRSSLVVTRASEEWAVGRAGMRYRDLLPGRQGGRFIASAIRIPDGGPVPDYVHYHKVRCQLIYCVRGSVWVVYEDQGPPFVMEPGDCVLQPPKIRHRVLESTPGLEVVEIGCPAEHETVADHDTQLPTVDRSEDRTLDRDWDGQKFVRHVAGSAGWTRDPDGFERRDTGISSATGGLMDVAVVRGRGRRAALATGELLFRYVLEGSTTLAADGRIERLGPGDSVGVPAGMVHSLTGDATWLEVAVYSVDDLSRA